MSGIARMADDSPTFADGAPLSPTGLNLLRDTALALDEATRMGGVAFGGWFGHAPEYVGGTINPLWRGGIIWRTGMTTLRVTLSTAGWVDGEIIRIARGDTGATYTDHALAVGDQTITTSIASGYTNEQAIYLTITLIRPVERYANSFTTVVMVEAEPVTIAATWPTVPTFSAASDITAARLNQLGDALNWLVRRVAVRYDPLFIRYQRQNGPYAGQPDVVWRGGVRRTALHTTLTATGRIEVYRSAVEYIRLYLWGTLMGTYTVPMAGGSYAWSISATLSGVAADTVVPISIYHVRESGDYPINIVTFDEVRVDAASGGASTLAAWDVRQADASEASLVSWLSSLASIASGCYSRLASGNGGFWSRQRAYTMRTGYDTEYQVMIFEPWAIPWSWRRFGEELIARGANLELRYGAVWYTTEFNEVGAQESDASRKENIVSASDPLTTITYFDRLPGLPPGAPYHVRGVRSLVLFERLKVVEEEA